MWEFLKQQIFPGLYAGYANNIIEKEYELQKRFDVDVSAITGKEAEFIQQIETDLKNQLERKARIEDKAKSLLFIITVAITAITFSLNYLSSLINNRYQVISVSLVIISIIYFVFGSIRVLQTLNIRPFHINQTTIKNETEDKKFVIDIKPADSEILKEIARDKILNDQIILRLSNFTYASFNLIRNGTIIFVLFFITTIVISFLNNKKDTTNAHVIHKEIKVRLNDSLNVDLPYKFDVEYSVKNLQLEKK